jgi:hypothetical protein
MIQLEPALDVARVRTQLHPGRDIFVFPNILRQSDAFSMKLMIS